MYHKFYSFITIFMLCFFFITKVQAATYCVDDLSDGVASAGDCASTCDGTNDCSLRDAIDAANSHSGTDTVDLRYVSGSIVLTQTDLAGMALVLSDSATIRGPGADVLSIDANGATLQARHFVFTGTDKEYDLSGVTLENANPATGTGSAIYVSSGSSLTVDSCVIDNNQAQSGGGIATSGGTITVLNSTISHNTAVTKGGGVYLLSDATLTIKNSTLYENTAGSEGGAIAVYGSDTVTVDILNATIIGNQGSYGGAIYDSSTGTHSITIQNSIIADNIATSHATDENCSGDTIVSHGHNLETGTDCGFAAEGDLQETDPVVDTTLFVNGGSTTTLALLPGSPAIDAGDDAGCDDVDIGYRDQRGFGRCVDVDGTNESIDIGAFELQAFVVDSLQDDADFDVTDDLCDIDDSVGDGPCTLRAAIEQANAIDSPGPQAVFLSVTDPVVLSSELSVTEPLAIYGQGTMVSIIDADNNDRVMSFSSGGAGYRFTLYGVTVQNGRTSGHGAGIYLDTADYLTITESVITNNSAIGVNSGGGIYVNTIGTLTMIDSTVSSNSCVGSAGGIDLDASSVLNMMGSTVSDNHTDVSAGGIMCHTCAGVNISNSTISGNTAAGSSGGLYLSEAQINLNNVTIVNNEADSDLSGSGIGGGIYSHGLFDRNIKNSILAGNTDNGNGYADCYGSLVSGDYNLIQDTTGCTVNGTTDNNITGVDPLLGALADNGGTTLTHALLEGSPAINAANASGCTDENGDLLITDQRGFDRPVDARCDIGAYEVGSCGDGIVDIGEECDDGNLDETDDCLSTCEIYQAEEATEEVAEDDDAENDDDIATSTDPGTDADDNNTPTGDSVDDDSDDDVSSSVSSASSSGCSLVLSETKVTNSFVVLLWCFSLLGLLIARQNKAKSLS